MDPKILNRIIWGVDRKERSLRITGRPQTADGLLGLVSAGRIEGWDLALISCRQGTSRVGGDAIEETFIGEKFSEKGEAFAVNGLLGTPYF